MGRKKLVMEYIQKEKARRITFEKRKKSLKRKAHELHTLCDIPVCLIVYEEGNSVPDTFPSDLNRVRELAHRYAGKRNLNLNTIVDNPKVQNNNTDCRGWPSILDGYNKEQLSLLVSDFDTQLRAIKERKIADLDAQKRAIEERFASFITTRPSMFNNGMMLQQMPPGGSHLGFQSQMSGHNLYQQPLYC